VIGQLAEDELLANNAALRTLLTRFRDPGSISTCTRRCSHGPAEPGNALRAWQTGQTGTSGSRACYLLMSNAITSICLQRSLRSCPTLPGGICSIETLLANVLYWQTAARRCRNGCGPGLGGASRW